MKLKDTTNAACSAAVNTIFSSASARNQLELASRFRFHLLGLYYGEVNQAWSSHGNLESDYLHHVDIVFSGRRQVVFHDEILQLEPGRAYWFPGNTPLERRCNEKCQVMYLKLRCEWLPGVDPLLDWPGRRPALIGPCDLNCWKALLQPTWEPTVNQLLLLESRVKAWVAAAVPDLDRIINDHLKTHAQFNSTFELIEDSLAADLRVEHLARRHGTSLHAFSMAFARNIGMGPKAYLKRRLNQKALDLLTDTNLSIKEIARKLKFFDEYHFSHFFKLANAIPPLRYRQLLTKPLNRLESNGAPVPSTNPSKLGCFVKSVQPAAQARDRV